MENPITHPTVGWLKQFSPYEDVWHLDTGGYYVGELDENEDATWAGTVGEWYADLLDQDA